MTKVARILQAIANGAETVSDVYADLNFECSLHNIAGHISNLKKDGKIEVVGVIPPTTGGRGAFRYVLSARGRHSHRTAQSRTEGQTA